MKIFDVTNNKQLNKNKQSSSFSFPSKGKLLSFGMAGMVSTIVTYGAGYEALHHLDASTAAASVSSNSASSPLPAATETTSSQSSVSYQVTEAGASSSNSTNTVISGTGSENGVNSQAALSRVYASSTTVPSASGMSNPTAATTKAASVNTTTAATKTAPTTATSAVPTTTRAALQPAGTTGSGVKVKQATAAAPRPVTKHS